MSDSEENSTLTDADGRVWEVDELQALVLQVGSFKIASVRLGLKPHEVSQQFRELGVEAPPGFVRKIAIADPNAFKDSIIREGSLSKAAKWYGCSVTHLKKVLDEIGCAHRKKTPTKEEAERGLSIFGSALLAARLIGTTPSEIKKACPDWKAYRDPLLTGRQAIQTGRIGEDYWEEFRGDKVESSEARDNPNFPDYDFLDNEFGKVNVKTANPTKEKRTGNWTWTWEVKPSQDAAVFPLVYLDRNRNPLGHFLFKRTEDGWDYDPSLRVVTWGNGAFGISIKASVDRPTQLDWISEGVENTTSEEITNETDTGLH